MTDFLEPAFMQRALVAGILLSALSAYFGVFVVQKKLSFLGAGLGHAAFGGIAAGLFFSVNPLIVAIPFTVVVALGITWVKTHTRLAGDTSIGIFFSVSVAAGVLFLSMREGATTDAFSYLFGSILAVAPSDLWLAGCMMVLGLTTLPRMWGRWAYATFDEEAARIDRIPTRRDDLVLSVLLALTIVLSVKVVGILLVAAWLVVPAASARLVAPTFWSMTLLAIAAGMITTVVGLGAAWTIDVPPGATIVLAQVALFIVCMAIGRFMRGN